MRRSSLKYRFRIAVRAGLALLVLLGLAWLPAAAQGGPLTMDQATLRVSPEYDDPGTLVIVYGTFANLTTFPQQITFPVPPAAHDLQTTEQDNGGSLMMRSANRQGDQVTYALEKQPSFQVEYYLEREPAGNDRTITYSWKAPYAIKTLTIVTQQPARATNFSMSPKEDTSFAGADGLTTYQITRTNVAAGDNIAITLKYSKPDQAPSFNRVQPAAAATGQPASAAAAAPAAAATGSSNWLAYALIGLGVAALIGAGVYWFLQQREVAAPARRAAGPAAAARPPKPLQSDRGDTRYCRKCGRPFAAGDRFCGSCGTPRDT